LYTWGLQQRTVYHCNGALRAIALGVCDYLGETTGSNAKGDVAALYQIAEAGFCHGLQQRVLVWIVQIKGGPV